MAMYKEDKRVLKNICIGVMVFIVLIIFFTSFYTISAGYRGILTTFGKPSMDAKGEGLHFKMPLIQGIVKMDVRTQKYEADLTAASKDLQDVNTKIAINYHILPESAPEIYQGIGVDYAEKVIYPLEQEINKETTAQYTAEELITKRNEVRESMKAKLTEKLRGRNIVVEEISIVNFKFSDAFTQAIEMKVTAEQSALGAKNKLEQTKYEAQQRVAEAQGKADAMTIEINSLKQNKDILQLRAIEKWNGRLPLVTGGATPFIDITKIQNMEEN